MNYVIIGNGAAGIAAAETLRKLDPAGKITIITADRYQAYCKCLLSDFLAGEYSDDRLYFRNDDFYRRHQIRILDHHRVTKIDFGRKIIKIADINLPKGPESELSYDRLLIASGSRPVVPNIKGARQFDLFYLNTLDDAKRIINAAAKAREAVIIGAGFVGVGVAFNLRKCGLKVTLVEKAAGILPAQLDETAAQIITRALEAEGIRVCLGSGVAAVVPQRGFIRQSGIKGVILDNGHFIGADLAVSAVGSIPNLDFVTPGTLRVKRGIVVNRRMMTSVPDVYAAGDVIEIIDAVTKASVPSPIWPNAVVEGEYAAYNMAGIRREINQLIGMQNAAEFREIPLITMGLVNETGPDVEVLTDFRLGQGIYRKIVLKGDRIIGMIFMGDISQSGVTGALIKNQTPVGRWKAGLLAPNFGYGMLVKP